MRIADGGMRIAKCGMGGNEEMAECEVRNWEIYRLLARRKWTGVALSGLVNA